MPTTYQHHSISGFTLIELAIVLVVIGLLIGATITSLSTIIQRSRFNQAETELDTAKENIIGYAISLGRLPCPDTDGYGLNPGTPDGVGNTLAGACISEHGFLPWVDLGGIESIDPWSNLYRYSVSNEYANDPPAGNNVTFTLASVGTFTINDAAVGPNTVAANIPIVVYSIGPNGADTLAAASADEDDNIDDNATFVSKEFVRAGGGAGSAPVFDDVISWISPFILNAKMVDAERLPE